MGINRLLTINGVGIVGKALRRADRLLATTEKTVAEIAYEVGFSSPSYFRRVFRKYTGMTPSAYRKSGGLTPL